MILEVFSNVYDSMIQMLSETLVVFCTSPGAREGPFTFDIG